MGFDIEVGDNSTGERVVKTSPNAGIKLVDELNGDLTVDTIFNVATGDAVTSVPVGGAISRAAAYWKSLPLSKILEEILFPDQLPTYTIPALNLNTGGIGLLEVGQSVSQVMQIRGYKNDAGAFTDLILQRSGSTIWDDAFTTTNITNIADMFGYPNPNTPNQMFAADYNESFVMPKGTVSWQAFGTYGAGNAKLNNKGVLDARAAAVRNVNAPQAGSSIGSNAFSVTADYPIFWGVSNTVVTAADIETAIEAGTANKVLVNASGTINITFAAAGQYLWFAYWTGYTSKTKWYVNALNNGNIGGGSNLFGDLATRTITSPTGLWSNIDFKIHISNYPTSTSGNMELRNS